MNKLLDRAALDKPNLKRSVVAQIKASSLLNKSPYNRIPIEARDDTPFDHDSILSDTNDIGELVASSTPINIVTRKDQIQQLNQMNEIQYNRKSHESSSLSSSTKSRANTTNCNLPSTPNTDIIPKHVNKSHTQAVRISSLLNSHKMGQRSSKTASQEADSTYNVGMQHNSFSNVSSTLDRSHIYQTNNPTSNVNKNMQMTQQQQGIYDFDDSHQNASGVRNGQAPVTNNNTLQTYIGSVTMEERAMSKPPTSQFDQFAASLHPKTGLINMETMMTQQPPNRGVTTGAIPSNLRPLAIVNDSVMQIRDIDGDGNALVANTDNATGHKVHNHIAHNLNIQPSASSHESTKEFFTNVQPIIPSMATNQIDGMHAPSNMTSNNNRNINVLPMLKGQNQDIINYDSNQRDSKTIPTTTPFNMSHSETYANMYASSKIQSESPQLQLGHTMQQFTGSMVPNDMAHAQTRPTESTIMTQQQQQQQHPSTRHLHTATHSNSVNIGNEIHLLSQHVNNTNTLINRHDDEINEFNNNVDGNKMYNIHSSLPSGRNNTVNNPQELPQRVGMANRLTNITNCDILDKQKRGEDTMINVENDVIENRNNLPSSVGSGATISPHDYIVQAPIDLVPSSEEREQDLKSTTQSNKGHISIDNILLGRNSQLTTVHKEQPTFSKTLSALVEGAETAENSNHKRKIHKSYAYNNVATSIIKNSRHSSSTMAHVEHNANSIGYQQERNKHLLESTTPNESNAEINNIMYKLNSHKEQERQRVDHKTNVLMDTINNNNHYKNIRKPLLDRKTNRDLYGFRDKNDTKDNNVDSMKRESMGIHNTAFKSSDDRQHIFQTHTDDLVDLKCHAKTKDEALQEAMAANATMNNINGTITNQSLKPTTIPDIQLINPSNVLNNTTEQWLEQTKDVNNQYQKNNTRNSSTTSTQRVIHEAAKMLPMGQYDNHMLLKKRTNYDSLQQQIDEKIKHSERNNDNPYELNRQIMLSKGLTLNMDADNNTGLNPLMDGMANVENNLNKYQSEYNQMYTVPDNVIETRRIRHESMIGVPSTSSSSMSNPINIDNPMFIHQEKYSPTYIFKQSGDEEHAGHCIEQTIMSKGVRNPMVHDGMDTMYERHTVGRTTIDGDYVNVSGNKEVGVQNAHETTHNEDVNVWTHFSNRAPNITSSHCDHDRNINRMDDDLQHQLEEEKMHMVHKSKNGDSSKEYQHVYKPESLNKINYKIAHDIDTTPPLVGIHTLQQLQATEFESMRNSKVDMGDSTYYESSKTIGIKSPTVGPAVDMNCNPVFKSNDAMVFHNNNTNTNTALLNNTNFGRNYIKSTHPNKGLVNLKESDEHNKDSDGTTNQPNSTTSVHVNSVHPTHKNKHITTKKRDHHRTQQRVNALISSSNAHDTGIQTNTNSVMSDNNDNSSMSGEDVFNNFKRAKSPFQLRLEKSDILLLTDSHDK
mgnify:CR=1 FL=1